MALRQFYDLFTGFGSWSWGRGWGGRLLLLSARDKAGKHIFVPIRINCEQIQRIRFGKRQKGVYAAYLYGGHSLESLIED
jgi:hypothetical protein